MKIFFTKYSDMGQRCSCIHVELKLMWSIEKSLKNKEILIVIVFVL